MISLKIKNRRSVNMWNAEIYNCYGNERILPSVDLINRISDVKFNRILDVDCCTGMSATPLVASWKN